MRSLLFEFLLCVFSGICFGWEMKSNDCLLPWKFDKNCSISQLKTEPTCQPGSVSENVPHWTLDDCITPFLAPDSGANLCLDLEPCLLEKVKLHTSLLPWDGSRLMIACLIHKLMCNQNSRFCMALENAGPKCILQKEKIDLCLKKGESIINLKQRHLFVLECFFGPRLDPLTENCKVPDAFIHFPLDLCFELEQRSEPLNVPAVATSTAPQTKLQWPRCYRGDDLRLDSCQKLSDWLSSCIGDADLFEKVNCKDTILSHYREIIEDHHSCTDDYIGAFHLCLHWKVYNWPLKGPVQQFCHTVEKNSCQKFSYPGQFEDLFNMNISQVAAKVWCIRNQLSGDCWSVKAAVENCMNETLLLSGLASCAEETMLPAVHRYMEILNDHENCSLDYVAAYQICLIHYLRTRSEANGALTGIPNFLCRILQDKKCQNNFSYTEATDEAVISPCPEESFSQSFIPCGSDTMDMDFNISDKITENIKCIREHVGKSCWSLSDRLRFCLNTSAGNDSFPNCDGEHPDYINQRYIEILTDRENCSDDYVAAYQMCALHYLAQKNQTKGPLQGPASYFCEILTDRTCRPPSKKLRENMEFNSDETDHSVTSDDSGSSNSPSEWQSKMLSYHLKISEFIRCVRKRKLFPCRSVHEKASECTDVSELKENLPACNSNRFGLQFYAILQDGTCQEDYVAAYYICLMERTKEEYGLVSLFCSILEDKTCRNITKRSSGGLLQVPSISIHSACLLSLILVCILRGY